jgi:hypothetical protein
MSDSIDCGTVIKENCKDLQIPWGEDWSFQMLIGDLIDTSQALIKFAVQYVAESLTDNIVKAINALRCALANGASNSWNLIAAVYWLATGLGQGPAVIQYLDLGYEYVCTCQEDAKAIIASYASADPEAQKANDKSAYMLSSCSESGDVKKSDAKKAQEDRTKAKYQAAMKAVRDQKRARIEKAQRSALAETVKEGGKEALEKKEIEAMAKYKAEAKKLEDKTSLTRAEQDKLEQLQMEYEAVRKVKEEIVIKEVKAEVDAVKEEGGVKALDALSKKTAAEVQQLQKKLQEFPDDEKTLLEFKAKETKMKLVQQTFDDLTKGDEISVREKEQLDEIQRDA